MSWMRSGSAMMFATRMRGLRGIRVLEDDLHVAPQALQLGARGRP
jgi:hypothetical protein